MFTLIRGTAVTTGHTTTDADTGFLSEFQRLQRLVADVLRVHPLSGAIEYESNAPLRVNASRWWEELQLQSEAATTQRTSRKRRLRHADARRDSNAHVPQPTVLSTDVRSVETRRKWMSQDAQERLVETLVRILHSLSVWTHELERKATGHDEKAGVLQHIEDAIGAVGVLVLREWSARDDAEAVATHVVNVLLQFHTEVGAFHPFHQHKLSASTAQRIFRTKPRWSCSRCERTWETHGPPEPILVFRCTACEFTICRECYTRVPNAAPELKELEMDREPFTSRQGISVQHFLPLMLDRLRLADASAYAALAPKLALAARERLQELLLYRSQEMVPTMQMIVDLYSTPGFARLFIEKEPLQWLPLYISSAKMRLYSFLGTLMGWTSMSDEPGEINLTPEGRRDVSSTALTLQWLDGYRTLRQMLSRLFVTLLDSETQDAFVIDAMLTYLATMITCFAATRSSSQSTDDLYDGILVNLSSALTHIASPILDKKRHLVTTLYHESFLPRRVYFDRAEPLRKNRGYNEQVAREADDARVAQMDADNIDKAKTTTNEGHTHYYPHSEKHFGVLCDNCDAADFEGPRYKCAFCEDVDICGKCYGEFVAQPLPTATQSEASILREAHIHRADHVLLRLSVPVPMIAARHFIPNEYRKPQLLYESDASTDVGTVLALKCSECDLALEPFDVYFKCSNCVNPRLVCPTCLENEEKHKDPSRAHVPGHLYFAIPREWRRLYNPLSRELFFRGLFYPPCIYPRERLSMETEIVYMTIKTLHIGPLHSLSRLLGVVKEMYELRSFCACEEQRVEFERRHQPRTARRVPKLSAHYSASQARLADLGATRLMAEMHLLETANVIDWIAFYSKTCRWLLELASPSQNPFKTILTDFSDAFSTFPEHFFVDLCDVMTMLTVDSIHDSNNVGRGGADRNALNEDAVAFVEPLLIMLVQLMATRKCTNNPHLRVQAAKALSAVMSFFMQDNKLAAVLRKVFQRCKLLRDYAVRAVLQFHEDMEGYHLRNNGLVFNSNAGSGDHLLWGFLSIRVTTVMLLRVMWQFADQRADLVRVFQSKARGHTGSEIDLAADMETPVGNQVSVLIMGLWSDAAKLLEEGNAKVSVLTQLADIREALLEGRQIQLPFRPSMLEGYIALHSKHLRVSMRMLVEVLELLSWIADNTALKRAMLKPELADQCARTTSFMISSVMTAYKSNALSFTWHHPQDNKRVFAHLVLLVVRCAGRGSTESSPVGGADLTTACSPSQFWSLAQECGTSMLRFVGDVEAHSRWELNRSIIRMESARYLGGDTGEEEFDEDTSEPELTRRQMQSDWRAEPVPREEEQNGFDFSEELDENAALALLEQQSSQTLTTLSTHAVATSSSSQQVVKGQRVVARQLGNRFVSALAKDGRFDAEAFLAGCELLKLPSSEKMEASEFELVGSAWMALYQQVLHRCQDVVKLQLAMDELLVDIPEEYLDPLLSTIMTDPVRLPSGNVVDRAVIERHLLSSNRVDPFTREPLTTEMLVPCDTLRREIQMYLRSKLHHLVHKKDDVLATWGLAWDCIFDVGADTK